MVGATSLTIFGSISGTLFSPQGYVGKGSREERLMEIAHPGGQRPCHITSETGLSSNCIPLVQVHTGLISGPIPKKGKMASDGTWRAWSSKLFLEKV